ncbi:Acyl-coenzyme A thioesterase PaaI [compost metagenome]
MAIGCSIDYIAPARLGDTLNADCIEQSRSGRTGNYDVRIENQQGQLIALFHGKSYKVRGPVLTQETPNE